MVGTRDQITSGRRSKRVLSIPFIFSGSPNDFWPHTFDACVTTNLEIRIAGDEIKLNISAIKLNISESYKQLYN